MLTPGPPATYSCTEFFTDQPLTAVALPAKCMLSKPYRPNGGKSINVKFTDDLLVDGKIEGEIKSSGNLTIGENARIKAEVHTGTIVVYGKIHGNLTASSRIDLKSSAEVVGDIKAATLSIEAGAIFVGKSTVGTVAAQQSAPEPEPEPEPELDPAEEEEPAQGTLAGTESEG